MRTQRPFLPSVALLLALLAVSPRAEAFHSTRSLRLGAGSVARTDTSFPQSQNIGASLWSSYDFRITEGFSLGVNLAYRYYWGNEGLGQLGYGLLFKHTLGSSEVWRPYLQYGLLFHLSSRTGHSGVPAAHDTLLSAGVDTERFFIQAGFHISHLSQWDTPTLGLSYGELLVGYHWNWAPGSN